jgi:hypothetical protein
MVLIACVVKMMVILIIMMAGSPLLRTSALNANRWRGQMMRRRDLSRCETSGEDDAIL